MGVDTVLWWPPFVRLYEEFRDSSALTAERLDNLLKLYGSWLTNGLQNFKPPSDSSQTALKGDKLIFGDKDIALRSHLVRSALLLSAQLVRCQDCFDDSTGAVILSTGVYK
jgi:hypothetical protein